MATIEIDTWDRCNKDTSLYLRRSYISRLRKGLIQPLTTFEQWKASRHRLLWVALINWDVVKRNI